MTDRDYNTPAAAEAAFYAAFEQGDVDAMMAVWAQQDEIECIHPLGVRLQGVQAIRRSWQQLLPGEKQVTFRLTHVKHIQDGQLAVHILYENISFSGNAQPPLIATNVYQKSSTGWHMILHHASPTTDISVKDDSGEQVDNDYAVH